MWKTISEEVIVSAMSQFFNHMKHDSAVQVYQAIEKDSH